MNEFDHGTTRPAGALLLSGAALLLAGNALHPIDATPTATSRFEFASGAAWLPVHLVIAAGILAVSLGLVLLASAARDRGVFEGTALAVFGLVGGGTLATVFAALDGFAVRSLASQWESTNGLARESLEAAATALEAIDSGLAGFGTLLLMGVGMLALSATLARLGVGGRWLPSAAAAVGVLGTVTGTFLLVVGPTATAINILLRPTAMGMTALMVATGIVLRRDAARVVPVAA